MELLKVNIAPLGVSSSVQIKQASSEYDSGSNPSGLYNMAAEVTVASGLYELLHIGTVAEVIDNTAYQYLLHVWSTSQSGSGADAISGIQVIYSEVNASGHS
jgi:hypothetical protein